MSPIPAAQYLRMSTDHQQYSLENQVDAIQRYANEHNFVVVRTYYDSAKTGIVLRNRPGLKQPLQDAVAATPPYHAILVYDVSRWGRFRTRMNRSITSLCANPPVFPSYDAVLRTRQKSK